MKVRIQTTAMNNNIRAVVNKFVLSPRYSILVSSLKGNYLNPNKNSYIPLIYLHYLRQPFNLVVPSTPFFYPLKTSENRKVF